MKLSVVILNYKVPYYLMLCLESVQQSLQNIDAEIIVIDNHSEDDSCQLVNRHFPEVRLIANTTNEGFSRGNNKGIARAKGDLICLLNPDTVVSESTFEQLLLFTEKHPNFGIIGPKLIDGRGCFLPESKRNIPRPGVALKKLFNQTEGYYAALDKNATGRVDVFVGAFMLMNKARYHEVGGLDEDYFMYGEDIDLSYKFRKAGYDNYYLGSETVLHFKGESTVKNKTYRNRFYGAMMIFYQKHFQKNKLTLAGVKLGLQLAKASHRFRKSTAPTPCPPAVVYWLGQDDNARQKFAKKTTTEVQRLQVKILPKSSVHPSLYIIDMSKFSYGQALNMMETYSSPKHQFRFKPKGFDFVIGSDSSTGKGSVTTL